jgi:hypothetical protein
VGIWNPSMQAKSVIARNAYKKKKKLRIAIESEFFTAVICS